MGFLTVITKLTLFFYYDVFLGVPRAMMTSFFPILTYLVNYLRWKHEIYTKRRRTYDLLFVLHTLFCLICTRKIVIILKTRFFYHYCALAVSLYSSNDFRIVTHKFVPGLLVLLHHKCICLLIKHLTIFRTCIIVLVFIHHSTLQQSIFSKMTGPFTQPFGEGKNF